MARKPRGKVTRHSKIRYPYPRVFHLEAVSCSYAAQMDEVFEGEIVGAEVVHEPSTRRELIDQCVQLHGTHDWRLHLDPDTPQLVEVYCGNCPAQLHDVWPGAIRYLHLDVPGYRVVDGTHTAQTVTDVPIDVFIRESSSFSMQSMSFATEFEVQIQFKGTALPSGVEPTGTGWCAPSP